MTILARPRARGLGLKLRTACGLWLALAFALGPWALPPAAQPKPLLDQPVLLLETAKGTVEIQLFRAEAPKSVGQIVELVRRNFYRGQRFHRVTASLVQVGDPRSRDMSQKDSWGNGGSGKPINAFEVSKKRAHHRGAVGLAHSGNPMAADSQIYIMKVASPSLDGKHAVIGQVTTGMAVVDKIEVADVIKNAYFKGEGPK